MSCKYCRNEVNLEKSVTMQSYISEFGELVSLHDDGDGNIIEDKVEINFCPKCGEDLREKHKISPVVNKLLGEIVPTPESIAETKRIVNATGEELSKILDEESGDLHLEVMFAHMKLLKSLGMWD